MKNLITAIILSSLLLFTACNTTPGTGGTNPDGTSTESNPYATGPDPNNGPNTIKGPTTPPTISTSSNPAEAAEVERTHQIIDTSFTDKDGTHEIRLAFNINNDEIRGILIQPTFEGEQRDLYHQLTQQILFKSIVDIKIDPIAELPEFSDVFIASLHKAIEMYKEKNPS